jgi:glycosyltransferase involved in cell wall biosynthesis
LKVLLCLNHFLPDKVAGTEVYCLSLAKGLQGQQVDVTVLAPNYDQTINQFYEIDGIPVIRYAEPSAVDRALIMGKRKPEGLLYFEKVLTDIQPDIIHFHGLGGSNGITHHHVLLAKKLEFKVLFTFHIAGLSCFTGNLLYKEETKCDGYAAPLKCSRCVYSSKQISGIKKTLLTTASGIAFKIGYDTSAWQSSLGTAIGFPFIIKERNKRLQELADACDRLIVLTEWYKKVLLLNQLDPAKLVTLTQALPTQLTSSQATPVADKKIRIAFIGRVVYAKGLHLLIDALLQLNSPDLVLDIYGQVNEEAYGADCLSKTKGNNSITWKGIIAPEEVVNTLTHYSVLCIPSAICEMSPLVIQEAFAAGIPVIASDVYGNAEQVKDGVNGWLFPFKDSVALQQVLQQLLNNPQEIEQMKKGLPAVKSFSTLVEEHISLYQSILNEPSLSH